MIKSWEELGDALADFENRILTLEMSQPYSRIEEPLPVRESVTSLTSKEWDAINQLKGMQLHLDKKLSSLLERKAKGKSYKYS